MDSVKLKKFNYASPPIYDLHHFDWDLVKSISISDSGSAGVIFIESSMGAIAIKGSSDPAIEYFSFQLLKNLNINVPEMVVYEFNDPEFHKITDSLETYCASDSTLKDRVGARISHCFLLVQEFIANNSICELGTLKAQKFMNPEEPVGQRTLAEIGMIVGLDTLTNMLDRYPIIWDNEGNEANVIYGIETNCNTLTEQIKDFKNLDIKLTGVYAIDNRPFMFSKKNPIAAKNYEKYMDRLKNLTTSIIDILTQIKDKKVEVKTASRNKSLNKLIEFVKICTGFDPQATGDYYLMLGIIISYLNAIELTFEEITKIYDNVYKFPKIDHQDSWKDNCKALNIEMINDTINTVKAQLGDLAGWEELITKEGLGDKLIKVNPRVKKEKEPLVKLEELSDEFLTTRFGINHKDISDQRDLSTTFKKLSIEVEAQNKKDMEEREKLSQAGREEYIAKHKGKPYK
jgi:hypothetical protein